MEDPNVYKFKLKYWLNKQDLATLVQIQAEISVMVQEKLKEITKQIPECRVK